MLAFSKWTDDEKNRACLTIIGCSVQGHAHLEVFTQLFKWNKVAIEIDVLTLMIFFFFSKVYLWSRNVKNAIDLQSKYASQLKHIEILKDLNDIRLQETDVICTCTGSEQPLIGLKQVKKGVHINGESIRAV